MDSRRAFVAKMTHLAGGLAVSSSRVLGANDRIRLGMIGPGFRGLQLIWSMRDPNAEFVAFADAYSGRLEAATEMANAKRMRAAHLDAPKLTVQIGHQDCSSGQVADALHIL